MPTGSPVENTSYNNTPVQPVETHRPGLVVTDTPAPEVIYRAGSHDAVLSNSRGNDTSFSPISTEHIETLVTRKANDLSHELKQLRNNTDTASEQFQELRSKNDRGAAAYYAAVAAVSTELQAGTTPGNPILVDRWNIAQEKLKIPGETVHLSPSIFRSEYVPAKLPPLPLAAWQPRWVKRMLYAIADRAVIDPLLAPPIW